MYLRATISTPTRRRKKGPVHCSYSWHEFLECVLAQEDRTNNSYLNSWSILIAALITVWSTNENQLWRTICWRWKYKVSYSNHKSVQTSIPAPVGCFFSNIRCPVALNFPPKSGGQPTVSDRWRIIPMQSCPIETRWKHFNQWQFSDTVPLFGRSQRRRCFDWRHSAIWCWWNHVFRFACNLLHAVGGVCWVYCGIIEFQPVDTGPHREPIWLTN